jgi:hypothetical protein
MRHPTAMKLVLIAIVTAGSLIACDAFLGPLYEPVANAGSGSNDELTGEEWRSAELVQPVASASITSDTVVDWEPLASPAENDPATHYALHLGTADEDGTYRIEYFVPYLEATEFDLARLPLAGGTEYYVAVIGRTHFNRAMDADGFATYSALDPAVFDASDGVFSSELLTAEDTSLRATYFSETFETFPTRFTYDGPGLAFAAQPTGVAADESAWDSAGTVTVSWTDPASGSLDSIRVTQFPGPAAPFTVASGDESLTLSDLSPYFAYIVWVQAVAGDGTVSEPAIVSFSPGASLGTASDLPEYALYLPETLIPGPGYYEGAFGIKGYTAAPRWIVTKYADGSTIGAGAFEAR